MTVPMSTFYLRLFIKYYPTCSIYTVGSKLFPINKKDNRTEISMLLIKYDIILPEFNFPMIGIPFSFHNFILNKCNSKCLYLFGKKENLKSYDCKVNWL